MYPWLNEYTPMAKDKAIIKNSNPVLCSNSIPRMGKLFMSNGSTAQWIAQATEAEIPRASQLILSFMLQKYVIHDGGRHAAGSWNYLAWLNWVTFA